MSVGSARAAAGARAHPAAGAYLSTALSWLATHWGVTDRLRQVVERPKPNVGRRLPVGHAVIGYGFFTLGGTPHAAINRLATALAGAAVPARAASGRLIGRDMDVGIAQIQVIERDRGPGRGGAPPSGARGLRRHAGPSAEFGPRTENRSCQISLTALVEQLVGSVATGAGHDTARPEG